MWTERRTREENGREIIEERTVQYTFRNKVLQKITCGPWKRIKG